MRSGRATIATVSIAASLCLLAPAAQADFSARDPDDTSGLDMRVAKTDVFGSSPSIRFSLLFFESMDWTRRPFINIVIDSTGSDRGDRSMVIAGRADHPHCTLYSPQRFIELNRIKVGTDRVGCALERRLLPTDGTPIRWKVVSHYIRGQSDVDRAPRPGDFYPRV